MAKRVRIEQFDQVISVEEGESILSAALAAGLDYPFMCQQGQCGSCKSHLVSGRVDLGTFYNPLVLTDAERGRGMILACQAQPLEDCVVSVAELGGEVSHVVREFEGRVEEVSRPTPDVTVIRIAKPAGQPFTFSAGQHVLLAFPNCPPRAYAIASRPDCDDLQFHIARRQDGIASGHVWHELDVGVPVGISGPFGSTHLREEHLGPILLCAEAAGLAPILSIIETALANGLKQRLHLYFTAPDMAGLFCLDRLSALAERHANLTVQLAVSGEGESGPYRRGDIRRLIAADFDDLADFHAYLAGSPGFCAAAAEAAHALGLAPADCFATPFVASE